MAFYTIELTRLRSVESSQDNDEDFSSIFNTELSTLNDVQRATLTAVVSTLWILSIFGNIGALYASRSRKVRLIFRTCLISLALSDLLTTMFMTVGYLAQFAAPYVQVWFLGEFMCRFIPFVTTGAILVSSMTLVGIALDRYLAVMRAAVVFWNPNKYLCIFYAVFVWGVSFGIASPMYAEYSTFHVYILDENESAGVTDAKLVKMCVSEKESNACYYILVLALIFLPTLVAFVLLNSIIANKLWIRRHSVRAAQAPPRQQQIRNHLTQQQYDQRQGNNKTSTSSTTLSMPTSMNGKTEPKSCNSGVGDNSAKHVNRREARHLRMFTIVLILTAVFIFFRLPTWIFLIMRMYGTYTRPVDWILHFSFGILTLASCVLNPLLYTFHSETIQYVMFVKTKLCDMKRYCGINGRCNSCLWCENFKDDNDAKMSQNEQQNTNQQKDDNGDNSTVMMAPGVLQGKVMMIPKCTPSFRSKVMGRAELVINPPECRCNKDE